MNELTYEDSKGETIYTSTYLKNRGSCCKTNCLHCPYGFTLKNHPINYRPIEESEVDEAQRILKLHIQEEVSDLTTTLMGSAFGKPKKTTSITLSNKDDFKFILLKDVICGVVKKSRLQAKELYLDTHFQNQEIDLDIVNSFI